MKKKHFMGLNIGSSSILVIFILLCLVTFAALSVISANADYKMSCRIAERTSDYYDANNQAQEYLAVIDEAMHSCIQNSADIENYRNNLSSYLAKTQKNISVGYGSDNITLDYRITMTQSQSLHVTLRGFYPIPPDSSELYEVQSWQIEHTESWNPDDSLQLADPESLNIPDMSY